MDFLNKAIAQLSELFRSMTPGARITAGLLLAVVVASMGYLFRQSASGPDAYLFGGEALSDGQLARMELAFGKAGLSDFQRDGNRIRVPSSEQAKYLAAVADAGALPPNFNTILEEAVGKSSPWEPREAQRERLKIARQQTLSEIVRNMDWVENAIVLYDDHETRGANQLGSTKQMTASVSVKAKVGETLTPLRINNIQTLVAHAVNMKSSDVAVTSLDGGGAFGADGLGAMTLIQDEFLKTKIAYEGQKRDSILSALRDIPGVRVEVNADFDPTVEETTDNVKPGEKPTAQRESTTTEETTETSAEAGSQVGSTAQGPNRQGVAQAIPQRQNRTHNEVTQTDNVVGIDRNRTVKKGYVPREVWATVSVPGAYIKNVWTGQNPTAAAAPKPEDLTKVQTNVVHNVEEIVDPLLYLQGTKAGNTYKHVRVVVMDSLPIPTIEPPTMATKAVAWTGRYWSTVAMLGVAMFSLIVLRSVVRARPEDPKSPAAAVPTSSLTLHADEAKKDSAGADDSSEPDRPRLRLKKGKSLKDDLVEIVRDDPNAAADILRSWISKAG